MSEYRNEIQAVERASRSPVVVPVAASSASLETTITATQAQKLQPIASVTADFSAETPKVEIEEQLATAAEYAKVHARIAEIMADLRSGAPSAAQLAASQQAVQALVPAPIIVVPLPPANKDMVARAELLAKDIAQHAVLARAAQANVRPGLVDQILATAN